VYIVDEVHMLSAGASNALLKTLEDPPGHVVFVLATTDPHKVLATIRSRTQHYDFRLLPASLLGEHLREVATDAGLTVGDTAIDRAVRRGDGSARDALSALDQIVAAGGDGEDDASVDEIVEGLCDRDTARALGGVAMACGAGVDPRSVAAAVAAHLRDACCRSWRRTSSACRTRRWSASPTRPAGSVRLRSSVPSTRSGRRSCSCRTPPDPRVTLEVALVKVTRPDVDASPAALLERIERLERDRRQVTTAIVDATSPLGPGTPLGEDDDAGTPAAAEAVPPARAAAAREALAATGGGSRPGAPVAAKAALGAVRGAPRSGGAGSPGPKAGAAPSGGTAPPPADAADTPAAPAPVPPARPSPRRAVPRRPVPAPGAGLRERGDRRRSRAGWCRCGSRPRNDGGAPPRRRTAGRAGSPRGAADHG
jgi:DNA polymerase-3 subunit gamma/tau